MKKYLLLLAALFVAGWAMANEDRPLSIAVFDPTSSGTSIDDGTRIAIREIISSTIVNTGEFTIVERSLLEKVMQEQQFSNSGIVAESDATEIGKMAGANKIILSVVTLTGGRNMLSIKMIDVKTANVDRQQVKVVKSGELLDVVEPMTLKVINAQGPANVEQQAPQQSAAAQQPLKEEVTASVAPQQTRSLVRNGSTNHDRYNRQGAAPSAQPARQSVSNSNAEELYLKAQSLYSQGDHNSLIASKSRQYRAKQQEAVDAYTQAAELGHLKAQFRLYEFYKKGGIVEEDPYESFRWLRRAAEGGHTQAQLILADLYNKGEGLAEKDLSQAIFWYEKAANNGHNPSQILMGDAYWNGNFGLETDLQMAIEWYERAAAKNVKLAMEKGLLFEEGKAVEEDFDIAKRFYRLALKQGEKKAGEAIEHIEKIEAKRARKR